MCVCVCVWASRGDDGEERAARDRVVARDGLSRQHKSQPRFHVSGGQVHPARFLANTLNRHTQHSPMRALGTRGTKLRAQPTKPRKRQTTGCHRTAPLPSWQVADRLARGGARGPPAKQVDVFVAARGGDAAVEGAEPNITITASRSKTSQRRPIRFRPLICICLYAPCGAPST